MSLTLQLQVYTSSMKSMVRLLTATVACQAVAVALASDQVALQPKKLIQNSTIPLPIAAGWIYMSDDQNYATIPSFWSQIPFEAVDVLYIGPVGVQADGNFDLFNSTNTGSLAHRFQWVISTARSRNRNIRIIASQWWGQGEHIWGFALDSLNDSAAITQYANSVASFVQSWSNVSGGIDGYDVDYEDNNVLETIPTILAQIRTALDTLSESSNGRQYYITASPSNTDYLQAVRSSIDFINMQTYAGGTGLSPDDFIDIGFRSEQLLYGYCPEGDCSTPTLSEVESKYILYQNMGKSLAGIHTWRLNSNNYQFEDTQQQSIYKFLHPT